MSTPLIRFTVATVVALACVASAVAQTTGAVRGFVRDQDGAALPGVVVSASSADRGTTRTAVSGQNGQFSFPSLAVGAYRIDFQLEGFREVVIENVRVGISAAANLNVEMALESIEEAITVTSGAPVLDTTSSSVGTNFSGDFIEELPLTRNFWDVMAVAPGVSQQSEQSTSMSAFGSGVASNSWSIDGLDSTNADTGEAYWWINPDTIEEVQVLAIGAPAQYGNMSGAAFNVVTKSGTNEFKGSARFFVQDDALTSQNATIDGTGFNREEFRDITLTLGGPLMRDRLWFFGAYQNYREGYTNPGEDPEFPSDDQSDRFDIKVDAQVTESVALRAKYHHEKWDFAGSSPYSTPSATGANFGTNPAWGVGGDVVINPRTLFEINYSGYRGDNHWDSKTRSTEDPFFDKAPPGGGPWLYSGGLYYPWEWDLGRDQIDATISHFADDFIKGSHELKFGVGYGTGYGDTVTAGGRRGIYYYRNEYTYEYYGYEYTYPYYYRVTSRAYHYGADTETISAFVDDSWQVTDRLTVNVGVRYDSISADIPDFDRLDNNWNPTGETIPGVENIVEWNHFSPRIGFAYQIGQGGVLRGFYGKFYDGNVTGNWYAPPPDAPDYLYEYSAGPDGPWTPFFVFEWHDSTVDPNLQAPETDQFTLGYEHQIAPEMAIGIQGIYKETDNLIGWEILDDGVYEMVEWINPFTGEVVQLASIIEQPTTRKGNRPGAGSLAPPGQTFHQDFLGATLTFNKRYSRGWSMMASYTWSDSKGFLPKPTSQVQGDPFYTGTDGRDPNNWINAQQALQNERTHVLQVQSTFELPWGLLGSAVYRYLDGKPYNRQLSVGGFGSSAPLNQGSQTVIAIPATSSVTRPAANIVDLGLARVFDLGRVDLRLDAKLLNALNDDAFDWWATLNVPPGDEYIPSGYIRPRRLMLQFGVHF